MCPNCLLGLGLRQPAAARASVSVEQPGTLIGRYKLLEPIGEGGFGTVWMAEQTEPVRRKVALKILKLGMDTKEVVARFEAERQALALMDHANIARVFDGGATDTGRPYFVMELVKGERITDYCDAHQLDTEARLRLFIEVCQAVQHAHQKGVIHRDLKPNNVLVTEQDGRAVPKVIDFGIAKATEAELTEKTLFTRFNQFLGTPAYMSPEQAGLGKLDVDTRSDIYSLGVLLYELLTGRPPFSNEEFLKAGLDEILRTIREKEPPTPSTRLKQERLTTRAADPEKSAVRDPQPTIDQDLDWIVMKCLEKDRRWRYETANGLARDLERHLTSEPVLASPPSRVYRARKFARRHRLWLTAGAAVLAAVLIGLGISTWLFLSERKARQQAVAAEGRALTEAAKRREVADFLEALLKRASPRLALGRDTTLLKEVLNDTAAGIGKELAGQPEVEAEVRFILGSVFADLADYHQAESMYRRSLELRRAVLGEDHVAVAQTLNRLAYVLYKRGDERAAEPLAQKALGIARRTFATNDARLADYLTTIADIRADGSDLATAETLRREVLALRRASLGESNLLVATALHNLALVVEDRGRFAEAERLFRDSLKMTRSLGAENADVASSLNSLGRIAARAGKLEEAEALMREGLALRRKLFAPEHPAIAGSLTSLGNAQQKRGDLAASEAAHREALAIYRKAYGPSHRSVAIALNNLAAIESLRGRLPEAESLYREALALRRQALGGSHPDLVKSLARLADVLLRSGKPAEAEPLAREALAMQRTLTGAKPLDEAVLLAMLGEAVARQERFSEAEPLLLQSWEIQSTNRGTSRRDQRLTLRQLADLYEAWQKADPAAGKAAAAEKWRQKLAAFAAEPPAAKGTFPSTAPE